MQDGKSVKKTDEYCTPEWLAKRVGYFDVDPCTNLRTHIVALNHYILARGDDGLSLPWNGKVWLNPPYSNPLPWINKLNNEKFPGRCTESMVLVKLDTSTKWWALLTAKEMGPFDLWTFNKRIQFEGPPGLKSSSNNFCSALIHHYTVGLDLYDVAQRALIRPRLDLYDVAQLWRRYP